MLPKEDNADVDEIEGMLVLVKGQDASGNPQYAYAAIPFERYDAFVKAQGTGAYDLTTFGTILCHGSAAEPPEEVRREMEEKHGAAHDFEQRLMDAISQDSFS